MSDLISNAVIDDVVAEALQQDLCFLSGPGQTRHVPFAFTPSPVSAHTLQQLLAAAPLLGRVTQALASQHELIQDLHAPLAAGDPFFAEMISTHRELHGQGDQPARVPLLLQRSDFMVDESLGSRLVECNSIAAGMAPFGARVQRLHAYIQERWPQAFARYSAAAGALLANPAIENMALALVHAASQLRDEHGDEDAPGFLMVVQEQGGQYLRPAPAGGGIAASWLAHLQAHVPAIA